jgi:hypothetical protein
MDTMIELIDKLKTDKTPVVVNAIGEWAETDGKYSGGSLILERHKEFLVLEVYDIEEKQQDSTKERIYLPIDKIESISERPQKIGSIIEDTKDGEK